MGMLDDAVGAGRGDPSSGDRHLGGFQLLQAPAILAKMATTLDEVSHGRLILGVGAGWNEPEYHAFGLPFHHRVDRFEEALQILKPLLKKGHVDFAGHYYQARNCEILPRGPRAEGPL